MDQFGTDDAVEQFTGEMVGSTLSTIEVCDTGVRSRNGSTGILL
jgi:hypothetical protein